jgi:hypothetical protein
MPSDHDNGDRAAAGEVRSALKRKTRGGRFDRYRAGLCALEDPVNEARGAAEQVAVIGSERLPPHSIHRVTEALERLMEEDAAADRPFIAALAISKARGGLPAPGFFECARRLGRFTGDPDGQDAWSFHADELNAVFARWGGSSD